MVKTFKDLTVWQEAMNLVEMIYVHTKNFPKDEMYGLTSQIRRAVVSIPANIAEGNGRKSRKEYIHFLSVANGSMTELETHLLIAERLNFLTKEKAEQLQIKLKSVGRLLTALRKSPVPIPQSLVPIPQSLVPIPQSLVPSPHSPVPSPHSPVPNP